MGSQNVSLESDGSQASRARFARAFGSLLIYLGPVTTPHTNLARHHPQPSWYTKAASHERQQNIFPRHGSQVLLDVIVGPRHLGEGEGKGDVSGPWLNYREPNLIESPEEIANHEGQQNAFPPCRVGQPEGIETKARQQGGMRTEKLKSSPANSNMNRLSTLMLAKALVPPQIPIAQLSHNNHHPRVKDV